MGVLGDSRSEDFGKLQFPGKCVTKKKRGLNIPPRVGIGQFARLLPSLDVVAVSQAPSPESNPNSPSPVDTMVGHYPTIES